MFEVTMVTNQEIEQHPCPSPDLCALARGGNCKPYGRLHFNLDDSDEFGTFIFRTKGFNSIRTLAARLNYYSAASGGLLSCLPLQLTLRGKSTTQSYCQPVYYVDLTSREGISLNDAITQAKKIDEQSKQAGFYQEAVDHIARQGFANAYFEMNTEEGLDLVEEFYTEEVGECEQMQSESKIKAKPKFNQQDGFVDDIQKGLQGSVMAIN